MRNPHTRSAVAGDCEAVAAELFLSLSEQTHGANLPTAAGLQAQQTVESMNATELRLVLRSLGALCRRAWLNEPHSDDCNSAGGSTGFGPSEVRARSLDRQEVMALFQCQEDDLAQLLEVASEVRDRGSKPQAARG